MQTWQPKRIHFCLRSVGCAGRHCRKSAVRPCRESWRAGGEARASLRTPAGGAHHEAHQTHRLGQEEGRQGVEQGGDAVGWTWKGQDPRGQHTLYPCSAPQTSQIPRIRKLGCPQGCPYTPEASAAGVSMEKQALPPRQQCCPGLTLLPSSSPCPFKGYRLVLPRSSPSRFKGADPFVSVSQDHCLDTRRRSLWQKGISQESLKNKGHANVQ